MAAHGYRAIIEPLIHRWAHIEARKAWVRAYGSGIWYQLRTDIQCSETGCLRSGDARRPRCTEITHDSVAQVLPKGTSVLKCPAMKNRS